MSIIPTTVTIAAPSAPSAPSGPTAPAPGPRPDEEALFRGTRRPRRRRWTIGIIVGLLIAGIGALIVLGVARGDATRTAPAPATATLPVGPYATLRVAGPLAVSPSGALYVADVAADRVLVRTAAIAYADEIPGSQGYGFEARQQLLSVIGTRVSLLWQQPN